MDYSAPILNLTPQIRGMFEQASRCRLDLTEARNRVELGVSGVGIQLKFCADTLNAMSFKNRNETTEET
jgi:hypothetical protein